MKISELCYELYKIDWKHSHMITMEREMDLLKSYYDEQKDEEYTYEEYIEDVGYNGELYVCYEEFCDAEYYDRQYMCKLLANDELIKQYYADIESKMEERLWEKWVITRERE